MSNETRINIRVQEEFKDEVEKAAKADSRTLTSFVIAAINEKMERTKVEGVKSS